MRRLLIELVLAAALIVFAWEKPLKERATEIPWLRDKMGPVSNHPQSSTLNPRPVPTPAPTISGAWMWDPNRKSPLDSPRKKSSPH